MDPNVLRKFAQRLVERADFIRNAENRTAVPAAVITMGATGPHNSHPRVIAGYKFCSNEYIF